MPGPGREPALERPPQATGWGRRALRSPAAWRLAGLIVVLASGFALLAASGALSAHRVRGWAAGYGVAGPVVFVALSSALTVALVPGPLLAGASGLLFGTALGTPVSILSATLGATLAFLIARRLAGDTIAELGGPRLRAASEWVGRRGFRSVLYARLAPAVPYTVVNYAAGLTPVRLAAFVGATALGVAPRAFAYTALGGHLGNLGSPETLVAVGVLVAMGIAGLALPWAQGRRAASRPSQAIRDGFR